MIRLQTLSRPLMRVLFALLLLVPLFTMILKVQVWAWPNIDELQTAIESTLSQSILSVLFSLILGFIGAMGLLSLKRSRSLIEVTLLVPSFLPSLFVILACLKVISPFPFGVVGIVLVHTIVYSGLTAVVLSRVLESRIGGFAELALIEGAKPVTFLRKVAIPLILPDARMLALYILSMCISSFSIPLVVGGRAVSTIEILIYEKVIINSNLGEGIFLCVAQFVLLFLLSQLSAGISYKQQGRKNLDLLKLNGAYVPSVLITIGIVQANLKGIFKGLDQVESLFASNEIISQAVIGTFFVLVLVAIIVFIFLMIIAFCIPHRWFEAFLQSFVSPSIVLTGFGLMLLGGGTLASQTGSEIYFKIAFGFAILTICSLYRLRWSGVLDAIKDQLVIAETLGSSNGLTFFKIVWPQVLPEALMITGLACFWMSGDFALSHILTGQPITLALLASSLMGSYRLEAASVFVWLTLCLGALLFIIFWSLSRVANKKLIS